MAVIRACAKQLVSTLTSIIRFLMGHYRKRSTFSFSTTESYRQPDRMHHNGQRIERVEPGIWLGHLTLQITSPDNWSLRLIMRPIGLSFWFTSLWMAIPTMSASCTSCNACSNSSFTLARNWSTGLVSDSLGGLRRTVSCVPTVLKRLYSPDFV